MKIGKLKRELYNWQYGIKVGRSPEYRGFMPSIGIWAMRILTLPAREESIDAANYQGFCWFWSPPLITARQRTFKIFGRYFRIVYPIKIG